MNAALIVGLFAATCEAHKRKTPAIRGITVSDDLVQPWRAFANDPTNNRLYWAAHSAALDVAERNSAHLLARLAPVERSFAIGWVATAHQLGKLDSVLTTREPASQNRFFLPPIPLASSLSDAALTRAQQMFVARVIAASSRPKL